MQHHVGNYWPGEVEIVDGEDCFLISRDGKKYLDFLAGWCVGNVGWRRAEIQKAVAEESAHGIYITPYFRFQETEKLAATLIENAPGKRLNRVFRCTSGSEAVEFAIKCARAATGKKTIVSIDGVYHGHTYGAASVGVALTAAMAPGVPGFIKLPMPDASRGAPAAEVISQFEKLAKENHDIAAFFSEPVWSNAGVFIPPPDFLPKIEKICREHDILFIMDEAATGFGRCGELFASILWKLEPDIMCLAKGLTGGYGMMGATLVSEVVFEKCTGIPQYSTFGWVPTDIAAAQANIEIILREKLWENAKATGEYLLEKLKTLENHKSVKQVRGIGLLVGVELADKDQASSVQEQALKDGLLVETAGSALFLSPPLTLTRALADQGAEILRKVII